MIAIIPAKKYSSRLKNKNLKLLDGKPLIYYTIKAALKSKYITKVIVSTDSKKIAKISEKMGAEVPFIRPKKLVKNNTTLVEVCTHALEFLQKIEKKKISSMIALQPTSPLRTYKDIDKAIKIFKKTRAEFLTSFTKTKPSEWLYHHSKNKIFKKIIKSNGSDNSQNLKQTLILNGAIYIYKKSFFYKKKINKDSVSGIIMPNNRSVDIDYVEDFNYAETLMRKK
jgi:CMP-N,N'-diacetyllegionaminic acid synthase|tara:strand:- start:426 stop:1100 length:675 start_codon:yes stop_codon:yes gene_type:complete